MFIQIKKNPNGSHAFQFGGQQEDGWAYLPRELQLPDTFPFVNIEVEEVTHPAITQNVENGETVEEVVLVPEVTRMEVVSITAGEEIPVEVPEPGPTQEDRITALEEQNANLEAQNAMLMECLLEMSEIVYA